MIASQARSLSTFVSVLINYSTENLPFIASVFAITATSYFILVRQNKLSSARKNTGV
jgi:hypothetical protein